MEAHEQVAYPDLPARARSSWPVALWAFCRAKPLGAVGALLVACVTLAALLSPVLAPFDPFELHRRATFLAPGGIYTMGTDNMGRDVLSRVIWGSRLSILVGVLSVALGTAVGGLLGLVSGYFGGATDMTVQRCMDALLAFPTLVLALMVVAVLGPSAGNIIIAIAIVLLPQAARVVRSSVLSIKAHEYITAARAMGSGHWRILWRHVLPNSLAPYIIVATTALGWAVIVEASLSFLGLGPPPPFVSWGTMLAEGGREYLSKAPWMALFPGFALSVAVFGVNLFGDALRDVLDPRLRGS